VFFFCVHLISFKTSELFLLSKHQKALQTKNTHQLDTTICHRAHVILAQVTAVCATVLATGGVPSAPKVFGPKNFKLWVCRSRRIASGLAANSLTFALQIETLTTNMKPQKRCEKILQWKMAMMCKFHRFGAISPIARSLSSMTRKEALQRSRLQDGGHIMALDGACVMENWDSSITSAKGVLVKDCEWDEACAGDVCHISGTNEQCASSSLILNDSKSDVYHRSSNFATAGDETQLLARTL